MRPKLRVPVTFLLLAWVCGLGSRAVAGSEEATGATTRAVSSVGMTVADMDRSLDFYTRVLGFEKVSDVEVAGDAYERLQGLFGLRMRVVLMKLGREHIELTEYLVPKGRPIPPDSRSNDRWFQHIAIVVRDMDEVYPHLRRHRVQHASTGPQRLPDWNPAAGGIRAFYFKDPDGHNLEVIDFPPGKGEPRWQRDTQLFLGIDHTAIVVADTDRSLQLYRDLLGMKLAGESENFGPEQNRLNNVFGARLRISTLKAAGGPGVEFLEYLTPRDGRPMPKDVRPNDILHWQTRMSTPDAAAAARRLRAGRVNFVSSAVVTMPNRDLGFTKGFLVRDDDGHALQFAQK